MNTIAHILPWIQLILALILIGLVLVQRASEGLDGGVFGGTAANGTYFARRGFEKFTFQATIVVGILFAAAAVASLVVIK